MKDTNSRESINIKQNPGCRDSKAGYRESQAHAGAMKQRNHLTAMMAKTAKRLWECMVRRQIASAIVV
jgi:hypothetical protein